MNKTLTQLFFSFCFSFLVLNTSAQITGINYTYTNVAGGAFITPAAWLGLMAASTDDAVATIVPTAAQFGAFDFGGVTYLTGSTIYVSSNGFISFLNPGGSLPNNSLSTNKAIIAPFWDDLKINTTGQVKYGFAGGGVNQTLIIQWDSVLWDHNATITALSFQIRIYENTAGGNANAIEFRYLNNGVGGAAYVNNGSGGASIGLSGYCNNDVFAFTGAGGAPNKTSPEAPILTKPSAGSTYRFVPIAHPYDNCATADTISNSLWPATSTITFNAGQSIISRLGTLLHSTQTAIALPTCGGVTTTSDVWYTFTKPANITNFEIYTDSLDCRGANYKTGIQIFSSCGGAAIACDFGSTGPAGTNASSYLNLTGLPCAATQYWMRVFSTDIAYRGYFRINIRPPGRDCTFANQICGVPYNSPLNLSTCGFGDDYDSTNSACHTPREEGEDYLFVYTPAMNACVNISLNNTPANSYPGFTVYQGCPTTGNCLSNVYGPGVVPLTFNNMSLVAGITYYFAVDYDANGGFVSCLNNFDLVITNSVAPTPTYDDCATPAGPVPVTTVTPGVSCSGLIDYNNNCASPSPVAPNPPLPGCGNFIDGVTPDVWLTFTSTSNASHQIDVSPGTAPSAQDLAMAVYTSSGGSCGPFTLEVCDDNSNVGMPSATVLPPVAGTVYYVRIWSNSGTQTGNFKICVATGCSPANDLPCSAIGLTVGIPVNGDNGCSSGAVEPGSATCWGGAANTLNTVWYSFVATSSTMKIRTRLFTLYDSQIAVYTGPCGPGMLEVASACNDNYFYNCGQAFVTKASDLTVNGLTMGTTYFIRVDGRGANTGTFEIIVVDGASPYPPVAAQDCSVPINVCSNSTFSVADPGYSGAGNYCDVGGGGTCMTAGEASSTWYTLSITGPNTLQWLLTTSTSNDYDWMVWCIDTVWNNNPNHTFATVSNYCNNLNNPNLFPWTTCNVSHIDNTGMSATMGTDTVGGVLNQHRNIGGGNTPPLSQAAYIPAGMTATFLISINNWSNTTVGFNFNWQGSNVNGTPPAMTWQNATSSSWLTRTNWLPSGCGAVPDCANLIAATIASGGFQPIISSNTSVKDITISGGASLTINTGFTLSVCGNFTNNGTLTCQVGSTVKFIGSAPQTINGTFSALNSFYNFTVAKPSGTLTLNTNIYIAGNDSINGSILNNNSKNTFLGGNFYNYNGTTSFTGIGTGTFTFNGFAPQSYTNLVSSITFNNVTMAQLAASSLTLTAGAFNDLIIGASGILNLTQGKIIAVAPREVNVTNLAGGGCTAGNATSYVEGNLRRSINTALNLYEFPVGNSAKGYQRFSIQYTSAPGAAYNILANFNLWAPLPATGPNVTECVTANYSCCAPYNNGYWNLIASTGSTLGTYTANAYPLNVTNDIGAAPNGYSIMKATSNSGLGPFTMQGTCVTPGMGVNPVSRTGYTSFSDFGIVQYISPLPIELLYFDAALKSEGAMCSWSTATEINNDHFELERSIDNADFIKIVQVKGFGAGVSTTALNYQYLDKNVCNGTIYYRLKQVDTDGRFSYSNIVSVNCKDVPDHITLYPNPANTILNISFNVLLDELTEVQIQNVVGMIVMKKALNAQSGFNNTVLEIEDLPSGVYYLIVKENNDNELKRQVKFLKY
ncbi:MAG: T9SS type A sorting domain-containing protein [Bacteroidota bacterium]